MLCSFRPPTLSFPYFSSSCAMKERQDTLCNAQIISNHSLIIHVQLLRDWNTKAQKMHLNHCLCSYMWANIYNLAWKPKMLVQRNVTPTAQMAVLCCQSFTLQTYTYPLAQRVSSFIILPHNKAQIHVRFYIFFKIFLTALRLHSGESSQNSERT